MANIEKFFDFLDGHLEKGYQNMKSKYAINRIDAELCNPDEDGYFYETEIVEEENIFNETVYFQTEKSINQSLMMYKIIKTTLDDGKFVSETTEHLYTDLLKLYRYELRKFKNYYGGCVMNIKTSFEKENLIEGILMRLLY